MEFKILGPFEVLRDGAALPLQGAKQRALLAILLLHANEIVASEWLVEELWTRPPETARTALQVYVSQLRKALEPDRARADPHRLLVTRPPGYLLQLDPGRLDSHRFEQLVERARRVRRDGAGASAPLLREALSLWRGPALADFIYEPFAQAEIARLEELRIAALEERLDADLALGRHGEMIGELEELVRAHPLRERLRGQLMLAFYRAGRQAEALEAYRAMHRALDEELGISPGPALRRLQEQILRQEPVLEGPREPVPEPAPPLQGEEGREARATVTILVGGRDEPPGRDPEAVRGRDERLREVATAAIERHGGQVESAPGGRVVGAFGVPRAHEDDALRAARAAVELLERTQADFGHGHATATRAGVATGEVVTAGSALSGEPLSLAARLEAAAGAGEILVDASTRGILGSSVHAEPCPGTDIEATRLLALIPAPPPLARLPRSALIGREGELAQLRQAFDRVGREGTVHLFTVLGGAGIGKSRLAEEFASLVAEDATVLAGRCLSYGERITFSALREVVGGLTAAGPLSELLAGEEDAALVAARVTEAIERAESNSALEEIFWAFRRLFESLAGERPLVLLLEDVHWAEPTLLDFVDYLAERVRAAPMLLLCLARPELLEDRPAWGGGKRNVSSLFLERLSDAESKRLVDALASGLPDATRARVLGTAEGNPLFLEQLLAMVVERPTSHGEIPIPPTVQAALAARLDRLGPGERAVLEAAAVVGKDFREEAVAALVPDEAEQFTSRHLDTLVAKELLRPVRSRSRGQVELRFAHGLIQQTTYRAIPKRARAGLHEGVAAWLEEALGSGAAEYAEKAGYHLEQAYLHRAELDDVTDRDRELGRRAADLLASAGRRAFHRGDMPAAVDLLGRATSLLPADDREGWRSCPSSATRCSRSASSSAPTHSSPTRSNEAGATAFSAWS
jgi:DNA-binding SARP family transcriptional activator